MVSGPSGVGKTTLLREVLARRPGAILSPSVTTRPPRPGEEGRSKYRFVSQEEFDALVARGALLEHARYAGHNYGTPKAEVEGALRQGRDVILEIEVQGANQVKEAEPDAVTIFVEPPSWDVLEARLRDRATESPETLERRLRTAKVELAAAESFDHRVVNDALEEAVGEVLRIMGAPEPGKDDP